MYYKGPLQSGGPLHIAGVIFTKFTSLVQHANVRRTAEADGNVSTEKKDIGQTEFLNFMAVH